MMGDYTEHLISMAGGDGDELDQSQRWLPKFPESEMRKAERDRAHLLALVREQAAQIERGNAALFDVLHKWRAGSHVSYSDIEDIRTALASKGQR